MPPHVPAMSIIDTATGLRLSAATNAVSLAIGAAIAAAGAALAIGGLVT